jgi:hypothetical protein
MVFGHQIHVYQIQYHLVPSIEWEPIKVLQHPEPAEPDEEHSTDLGVDRPTINFIRLGNLFRKEVICAVDDIGRIMVWYVDNLNAAPILLENDIISTWSIATNSSKNYLAVSANDHLIRMWNLDCLRADLEDLVQTLESKVFRGHSNNIPCIDFNSEGSLLCSASIDGTLKVWSTSTQQCLFSSSIETRASEIDPSGWGWCVRVVPFDEGFLSNQIHGYTDERTDLKQYGPLNANKMQRLLDLHAILSAEEDRSIGFNCEQIVSGEENLDNDITYSDRYLDFLEAKEERIAHGRSRNESTNIGINVKTYSDSEYESDSYHSSTNSEDEANPIDAHMDSHVYDLAESIKGILILASTPEKLSVFAFIRDEKLGTTLVEISSLRLFGRYAKLTEKLISRSAQKKFFVPIPRQTPRQSYQSCDTISNPREYTKEQLGRFFSSFVYSTDRLALIEELQCVCEGPSLSRLFVIANRMGHAHLIMLDACRDSINDDQASAKATICLKKLGQMPLGFGRSKPIVGLFHTVHKSKYPEERFWLVYLVYIDGLISCYQIRHSTQIFELQVNPVVSAL